ncbi:MAG TPA: prepilin-type N-terminal cleavage/methylation domain-containing protein, partial [Deltaproteobacteria bacterium]|nr:prepilin-type N-terminal cleavage/methylation domain-containing protein [Deltaproteobacteria bacterium]
AEMRKGLSLIEVLVALAVTMAIFMVAMRVSILSTRTSRYSESLTYASALGHAKLMSLKSLPHDSPDLDLQWHKDPDNPILCGNVPFYRFWQVSDVPIGKEIILFVAWDDHLREKAQGFGSLASLQESGCAKISFKDVFLKE